MSKDFRYLVYVSYQESNLSITSSDALPLSYRRLVGAKAIKLGHPPCDKHPAYC